MNQEWHETLIAEVELIQSFIHTYRAKLGEVILRMNETISGSSPVKPPSQAMGWCVEAVDMILSSHSRFAEAMKDLAEQFPAAVDRETRIEEQRRHIRRRFRTDPPR
jgi:hypothetical protein